MGFHYILNPPRRIRFLFYYSFLFFTENVGPYSAVIFTRFTYQAILNATPSVDSFFTLR